MPFLHNIQQRLLGNVLYKFSLIFCSLYVVLFFGKIEGAKILFYLFISMLLCIGIAGLGYAFNDIKDYNDDIRNNKQNLFINYTRLQSACLLILFILLAVFPWFYLPFDIHSFYLLLIEFILFYLYAFKPFRLKEKGILGVMTDALYAQVVPCLLAIYTFSKLGNTIQINYLTLIIYALWLLLIGIRNIIKHQIEDFENDKNTNTNTFVTHHGILFSNKVMSRLYPAEIISFASLLILINLKHHIVLIVYVLYVLFLIINRNIATQKDMDLSTFINKRIFNEFYEIHLPLILLMYFSYYNHFFLIVALMNLFLFLPIYISFVKGFGKKYFG